MLETRALGYRLSAHAAAMPKVIYLSADGVGTVIDEPADTSVMHAAVMNGIAVIVAECGGSLMCATCHVYVGDAAREAAVADCGRGSHARFHGERAAPRQPPELPAVDTGRARWHRLAAAIAGLNCSCCLACNCQKLDGRSGAWPATLAAGSREDPDRCISLH